MSDSNQNGTNGPKAEEPKAETPNKNETKDCGDNANEALKAKLLEALKGQNFFNFEKNRTFLCFWFSSDIEIQTS